VVGPAFGMGWTVLDRWGMPSRGIYDAAQTSLGHTVMMA